MNDPSWSGVATTLVLGVLVIRIGWPGVVGVGNAGEPRTIGFCGVPGACHIGTNWPSEFSTNVIVRGTVGAVESAAGVWEVEVEILSE